MYVCVGLKMTLLPGVVVYTLILAPWRLTVGRIELHREAEVRAA